MKICVPETFGEDNFEDEELFNANSPSGSVLSADAEPFHPYSYPEHEYYNNIDSGIAIYNDGVPSMTLLNEHDRYEILNNIADEALLDEACFPLDAADAAELEAAEAFVIEMANLSFLEEREEQARQSFAHFQKRWEIRRQKGPSGRPRPCMNLIIPTDHSVKTPPSMSGTSSTMNSLVAYSHALRAHEEKMRAKEILLSSRRVEPRHSKLTTGNASTKNRRPIQQPRKDS